MLVMGMFSGIRLIHTSRACYALAQKSVLAELRKKTGYGILNCKKALEENNNDLHKAEKWLHAEAVKQGWIKALKGRVATQGLIGIIIDSKAAAMVEVNCETDFVAKNVEFQELVQQAAMVCQYSAVNRNSEQQQFVQWEMNQEELNALPCKNQTLADLAAFYIGRLGETISLRRAVCLRFQDGVHVGGYVHPASTQHMLGKYGALVAYKQQTIQELHEGVSLEVFGRQLSQHVIGMNPKSLGSLEDQNLENTDLDVQDKQHVEETLHSSDDSKPQNENTNQQIKETGENTEEIISDDEGNSDYVETRLLYQNFLADPEITVAEALSKGSIEILNFVRFGCGEEVS